MMRKILVFTLSLLMLLSLTQAKAEESTCLPLTELYGDYASHECELSCGEGTTQCYFNPLDKNKSAKYSDPNCSSKCNAEEG